MKHEFIENGQSVTIRLSEALEFADHDHFRSILHRVTEVRPKDCVFDLEGLESADSAGLGMLMIAYQNSLKESWKMSIRKPVGRVRKLIQITDIGRIIPVI